MSDAIISAVLTQLASILQQQITQELTLVVGVDKEVKNLEMTFTAIRAVIADAERRQLVKGDGEIESTSQSVKLWLQRLQDVAYDVDDVLSEWSNALLKFEIEDISAPKSKVCFLVNLPCFCFSRVVLRRDIAVKIQALNSKLDKIASDKDRYSFKPNNVNVDGYGGRPNIRRHETSYVDVSKVHGRDGPKATLTVELLKEGRTKGYDTITVVGTGGIGKTTLAGIVYNSDEVVNGFPVRAWVCVSEPPFDDELRVAKAIVEQLSGYAPNLFELESVLGCLRQHIEGKRFLFVLDDVWTEDYQKWESLRNAIRCGAPGSKALVTTRKHEVAKMMESRYTMRLGELSENDCWLLFSQIAFHDRKEEEKKQLEAVGKEISKKCKGLPLAAKILGNYMRSKDSVEEWRNVLGSEIWELEATNKDIFPALLLSYNDLPSPVKNCFLYCANFPQDYEIEADNLIKLWMAQDYLTFNGRNAVEDMEALGNEYLKTLVMRSFFQKMRKEKDKSRSENVFTFKMHDIVLHLAQYLKKYESLVKNCGFELSENFSSSVKARHLTLMRSEDSPFPEIIGHAESLHSLWVQSFYDSPSIVSQVDTVPAEFLKHLIHLKSLDLSRNRLRELPKEIEVLQNLRYLNLSHNPIWELPETVCVLYRLQTLKLVACNHLSRLPEKIHKLKNLRHLEIEKTDSLTALPKGIGQLTSLRTLSKFILTNSSEESDGGSCTIGDLSGLNNLSNSIEIQGLGYVTNATDAKKAELMKKHMTDMCMNFKPQIRAGQGRADVADALELHPNVQSLHISFYNGDRLPHWLTSLTNLSKLKLEDCPNVKLLTALGTLPSLENLCLEKMHALSHVGAEFFGASAATTGALQMFPKLKKLTFAQLNCWEEWTMIGENGREIIMPSLQCLKVLQCEKLKTLPDCLVSRSPLKKLYIKNCPLLQELYDKKTGEHWMKIAHIPKIRIPKQN